MKLTQHFKLEEFINSQTAKKLGIENTPNEEQLNNIKFVAEQLELIRNTYKMAIHISSGFRSEELNNAVGGVLNSYHCKGLAVDINQGSSRRNHNLFLVIKRLMKLGLQVEELIDEYNYSWIHIAFAKENPSLEVIHTKEKKSKNA